MNIIQKLYKAIVWKSNLLLSHYLLHQNSVYKLSAGYVCVSLLAERPWTIWTFFLLFTPCFMCHLLFHFHLNQMHSGTYSATSCEYFHSIIRGLITIHYLQNVFQAFGSQLEYIWYFQNHIVLLLAINRDRLVLYFRFSSFKSCLSFSSDYTSNTTDVLQYIQTTKPYGFKLLLLPYLIFSHLNTARL